jgi:hypothetical protein
MADRMAPGPEQAGGQAPESADAYAGEPGGFDDGGDSGDGSDGPGGSMGSEGSGAADQ